MTTAPLSSDMRASTLLGEIVTWSITGKEVRVSDVHDSLLYAELPTTEMPDLAKDKAFGRAVRKLEGDRLIRLIKQKDARQVKFQLTQVVEGESHVEFVFEALVWLNLDTGKIDCADREIKAKAEELLSEAEEVRTSPDISRCVQRLFSKHADLFPINPKKGVAYFVPAEHLKFVAKCEKFLNRLGGSFYRFPVPVGDRVGRMSVKDSVEAGMQSMLSSLEEAIDGWDKDTRPSTKERAWEKVELLLMKQEAYADYLGDAQASTKQNLKRIKDKILAGQEGDD
tara:strand:+ start:4384 stop:5232 length:849 start_codon:yes stop_codon:yes gene_type:complete